MGKALNFIKGTCRAIKFLLTPSLVAYFAQAGGIYLINAAFAFVTMGSVHQILCQIPGEWNAATGQKVGCNNCSDILLTCGKNQCYKSVMNTTMKLIKTGKKKSWKDLHQQALLDKECNLKVSESTTPVQTVMAIIGAKVGGKGPSDKCLQFHCLVVVQAALTDKDLRNADSSICPNAMLSKPPALTNDCVCNSMPMSLTQASAIAAACGTQAATLPAQVFEMELAKKNDCFTKTINASRYKDGTLEVREEYKKMKTRTYCVNWFDSSSHESQWLKLADETTFKTQAGYTPPSGASASDIAPCMKIMCKAFANSISHPSCLWQGHPYDTFSEEDATRVVKLCGGEFARVSSTEKIAHAICAQSMASTFCQTRQKEHKDFAKLTDKNDKDHHTCPDVPFWALQKAEDDCDQDCGNKDAVCAKAKQLATTITTTACEQGTAGCGASVRRLPVASAPRPSPSVGGLDFGLLEETHHEQAYCTGDYCDGDGDGDGQALTPSLDDSAAPGRQLQGDGDGDGDGGGGGGGANDLLAEYQTGAWSQCQCYIQCIAGAKFRDVTCQSDKCKSPKPAAVEKCVCTHCAKCNVAFNLMLFTMLLGVQGVCGLVLFVAFLAADQYPMDDFASVPYCSLKAPLGIICKLFPVALRVFVYVNLAQVVMLFVQAFIPFIPGDPNFAYDCKTNMPLQILVSVNTVLWCTQLAYGIYMRKKRPVPPQLHSARAGGRCRRLICMPLRAIGP